MRRDVRGSKATHFRTQAEALADAIAMDPSHAWSHMLMAKIFLELKRYREANSSLEQALSHARSLVWRHRRLEVTEGDEERAVVDDLDNVASFLSERAVFDIRIAFNASHFPACETQFLNVSTGQVLE